MTIANMITSLRILFVPALFIGANHKLGSVVWIIAAITDFLDGWIARTYKQQSALGELLDPIADKIIMAAGLIVINRQYPHYWLLIPSIIIMIRDFYITKKRIELEKPLKWPQRPRLHKETTSGHHHAQNTAPGHDLYWLL